MLNIYDYIENSRFYKTFKVDDLLFVQYKCMFKDDVIPYWTHNNYFSYILTGDSKYVSGGQEYHVQRGDAVFVRKGTYVAHGHGKEGYCALLIFVPDDFIKAVLEKYPKVNLTKAETTGDDFIYPINLDEALKAYFHSVLSYFPNEVSPSPDLLRIKFEELLLSIMTSQQNQSLAACLGDIQKCGKISLRNVMETSFMYNMSLEEYARLCGRSLSVFKGEFQDIFKISPGKWLIKRRLQHASLLIETSNESINDIAFKSGFKNTTHFVKVFKDTYGIPPLQYRMRRLKANAEAA